MTDDHEALRDAIKLLFKDDEEITVVGTASDGKELMEMLELKNPDVVLTDISMPRMNGVEVCAKVLAAKPHVKVVAFSMFEDQQAIQDMLNAGARGYVLKRKSLKEVRKAIIAVARGDRYFDASINEDSIQDSEKAKIKTVLSVTEYEILKCIAQGKSSSEIANERHTAVSTVIKHRKNMIHKLKLDGKGELLRYALQQFGHY